MNRYYKIVISIIFFLLSGAVFTIDSSTVKKDDPTFKIQKLSDKVMVLTEESPYENNIVAIASQKGLVVVDTSPSIITAAAAREIIEDTFKRKDFIYAINTHFHGDHAFGNQVFSDATIIGHRNSTGAAALEALNIPGTKSNLEQELETLNENLKGLDPASAEAAELKQQIDFSRRNYKTLKHGFALTLPDITFSDRLTLDLGDITLELVYFGSAHSDSDILIHVPEERILITGDLFLDQNWLPLFAGQIELDVPRWIEVLHLLLDGESSVEQVIPGHQSIWSRDKLILWRDYIVELWNGVKAAEAEGLDLEAILARFPLGEKYLYLKKRGHSDDEITNFHRGNIRAFWGQGKVSAAVAMEKTIEESGIDAALELFHAKKTGPAKDFHIDEKQFNDLGYQLLNEGKVREAVEILKLNTAVFPNSWNVYDSLAEAYMENKNIPSAVTNFKKSLELNPENQNAVNMLKRLERERSLSGVSAPNSDVEEWASVLLKAHAEGRCIPAVSRRYPNADERTAYNVQKTVVEKRLAGEKCTGFKAGLTSGGSQKQFGTATPVSGVLFTGGERTDGAVIRGGKYKALMLETEIGFVTGKPITHILADTAELRRHIKFVMPAIELPDLCFEDPGKLNVLDIIAGNVSAAAFIKGSQAAAGDRDLNAVSVVLYRDGKAVNRGTGHDALGDQWEAALWLVNTVVKQGWKIEPGRILLTGALGKMVPGAPGSYTADYGDFGKISFVID